jgi:Protein of unknown function DUF45
MGRGHSRHPPPSCSGPPIAHGLSCPRTVAEDAQNEPYFTNIGDKAEQIAQDFDEKQKTTEETLQDLRDAVQDIKDARGERAKSDLSAEAFGVFGFCVRQTSRRQTMSRTQSDTLSSSIRIGGQAESKSERIGSPSVRLSSTPRSRTLSTSPRTRLRCCEERRHEWSTSRGPDDWKPLQEVVIKDIFKAEIAFWTIRIGVGPGQVHVRPMTRKWGSCSKPVASHSTRAFYGRPPTLARRSSFTSFCISRFRIAESYFGPY